MAAKKRKVKRFVEWGRVWEDLDDWWKEENAKREHCSKCESILGDEPTWEDQMGKVEELVEAQLAIKR